MLAVLAELSGRPARPRDIESSVPGVTRRTALRRLQALARRGYADVTVEEDPGVSSAGSRGASRAPYTLTELGGECLPKVVEAAAHCERRWCPPPSRASGGAGLWTIKLIADLPSRAIVRVLADAPLRQSELLAHLPLFARSTLLGRLKMLSSCDVLAREAHSGEVRYGLTDGARHLVVVALRAAACEARWAVAREVPSAGPRADALPAGDLPGLLHVLAPLARVNRDLAGACRWRLDSPGADTYLTARSGRVAALGSVPLIAPEVDGVARPEVWCEALLSGDPSRISVAGERALFDAIFGGLSAALLA